MTQHAIVVAMQYTVVAVMQLAFIVATQYTVFAAMQHTGAAVMQRNVVVITQPAIVTAMQHTVVAAMHHTVVAVTRSYWSAVADLFACSVVNEDAMSCQGSVSHSMTGTLSLGVVYDS